MSLNICISDWSDPARWSPEKRARKANLWSLYHTATKENTQGIVGKKLIAFQPGLPINAQGLVWGHPYAQALLAIVEHYNGRTFNVLFKGDDGGYLELIDITKRGLPKAIAQMRHEFFADMDGSHNDYHTRPDSLNVRDAAGALVTYTPEYLDRWDASLSALTAAQRALDPDAIIIGQCDRLQGSTWSATNGQWIENNPWANGRTPLVHAQDIAQFNEAMRKFEPSRPMVSVVEIQEPSKIVPREMDLIRAWCAGQQIYLSVGRDNAAIGAA